MEPEKSGLKRRHVLAGLGLSITLPAALPASARAATETADLAAAHKEGTLMVMHADQESDVVSFLQAFTAKTGIPAAQTRALPGEAMPKLAAQIRTGDVDVDVYDNSDPGLMDVLRERGMLMRYESPEIAAYETKWRSAEPGWWTTYFINIGPMMYDPRYVSEADAPKTYQDLLNPRWAGQIGFQNAAAGTQYNWWYLLRTVLPKDFWTKLAVQKPLAYSSSTQILTEMQSGGLKIGGKVSSYQYVKARRLKQDIRMIFPPEGTPAQGQVTGIIAGTKRPNAAKLYVDYILSREGQEVWNRIQGSNSVRGDVEIADVPSLTNVNILAPTDFNDYRSTAHHAEFVSLWNKITGL
jgi:iron(III) transport system substrate-binding protein